MYDDQPYYTIKKGWFVNPPGHKKWWTFRTKRTCFFSISSIARFGNNFVCFSNNRSISCCMSFTPRLAFTSFGGKAFCFLSAALAPFGPLRHVRDHGNTNAMLLPCPPKMPRVAISAFGMREVWRKVLNIWPSIVGDWNQRQEPLLPLHTSHSMEPVRDANSSFFLRQNGLSH